MLRTLAATLLISSAALPAPAGPAHPLLVEHCTKCHGGAKQKGGLDLRSDASMLAGGDSGPAAIPGDPDHSRLILALLPDADPHMPPKAQLPDEAIASLRRWVADLEPQPAAAPAPAPGIQLPPGISPSLAIDLFLQAGWRESGTAPAAPAGDNTFVRRVYVDLLGRIPTRDERGTFLAATSSDKRDLLIDRLTESPEHAAHLTEIFNVAFLDREDGMKKRRERRAPWLAYLRWAFATNRPWDQVARDLLVARPQSAEEGGASWFLYEQGDDHQQIATRVSASLLGKQVQCAQCHNHPVSPEIEQRQYWGLVSFFSRSLNVKTQDGPRVAERASGGYAKFSNLKGESSETELVLLSGATVEEPGGRREAESPELYAVAPPEQWFKELAKDEQLQKDLGALPVPKFSRREEFAKAATSGDPAFSRAIVNRLWSIAFGRGLVHPVDQMDSAHPPSHPELLDWLARDFTASGHDVRRLLRALVKTRAYQLGSRAPGSDGLQPQDQLFARALDKPLSGEALYRSMRVAVGQGSGEDEAQRTAFVQAFPDLFAEVYSPTVQQAMFITNGASVDQLVSADAPLLLELTKTESPQEIARQAFVAILGRDPDAEELGRSVAFLGDPGADGVRQFCWALLASAEFRINH